MPKREDDYSAKVTKAKIDYWVRMNKDKSIQDHLAKAQRDLKKLGAELKKNFSSFIGDDKGKEDAKIDQLLLEMEGQTHSLKDKLKNIDTVLSYYCKRIAIAAEHPDVVASNAFKSIKSTLNSIISSVKAIFNKLNPSKDPEGVKGIKNLFDHMENVVNKVVEKIPTDKSDHKPRRNR